MVRPSSRQEDSQTALLAIDRLDVVTRQYINLNIVYNCGEFERGSLSFYFYFEGTLGARNYFVILLLLSCLIAPFVFISVGCE